MLVTDGVYLNSISLHIGDGIQVKMLLRQFLEIWSVLGMGWNSAGYNAIESTIRSSYFGVVIKSGGV